MAAATAIATRQAPVVTEPGMIRRETPSSTERRGGAAPTSPAESRSARTAPSTVHDAAIQAIQARLASQAACPRTSVWVGQVTTPLP